MQYKFTCLLDIKFQLSAIFHLDFKILSISCIIHLKCPGYDTKLHLVVRLRFWRFYKKIFLTLIRFFSKCLLLEVQIGSRWRNVQILDESVCNSLCANAFGKGMTLLSFTKSKIVRQFGLFSLSKGNQSRRKTLNLKLWARVSMVVQCSTSFWLLLLWR